MAEASLGSASPLNCVDRIRISGNTPHGEADAWARPARKAGLINYPLRPAAALRRAF